MGSHIFCPSSPQTTILLSMLHELLGLQVWLPA
jgi:hypothetical protein